MRAHQLVAFLGAFVASAVGFTSVYPGLPMADGAVCGLVYRGQPAGGQIEIIQDGVYLVAIGPDGNTRVHTMPASTQSPQWTDALIGLARSAPVSAGALIRLKRATQTIELGRFHFNTDRLLAGRSAVEPEQPASYVFTAGEFVLPAHTTAVGGACVMYGSPRRR